MGFTAGNMKSQLHLIMLLFLLGVHLVRAISPSGAVSNIKPMEVGGKDGCELSLVSPNNFSDGKGTTRHLFWLSNLCKSCEAESVIAEIRFKENPNSVLPIRYIVPGRILPGGTEAFFKDIPSGYLVGEMVIVKFKFVNCSNKNKMTAGKTNP